MTTRALDGAKLLGGLCLLLRLRASSSLGSEGSLVGVLPSDGLALFNLHDFLDDAVLHELVDLRLVNRFPVLHEFPQSFLKQDLEVVNVFNLVVALSTQGLQNGEISVKVSGVGSDLLVVVLHYAVEELHLMFGGGRLHSLRALGLLVHLLL